MLTAGRVQALTSTGTPKKRKAAEFALLAIVLCFIAIFNFRTIRVGQEWNDDVGQYLQQAKNIATHAPYGSTLFVFQKGVWAPGPRVYPPLFPLALSVIYRWRGLDLHGMQVVVVISFLLALVTIFFAFRADHPEHECLAVVALAGFNPILWHFKDAIMPDIPFIFLLYAALFAIEKGLSDAPGKRNEWLGAALTGLLMYLAYATKLLAIALIPLPILWCVMRRRRITLKPILMSAVCAGLVLVQFLATRDVRNEFDILNLARTQGHYSFRMYARFYVGALCSFFNNGPSRVLRWSLFTPILVLAFAGAVRQFRRSIRSWEIFAAFNLILILIWEQVEVRYLFPIFPLFLFYVFGGLRWFSERMPKFAGTAVFALLLLALGASYATSYAREDLTRADLGMTDPAAEDLYAYVGRNLSSNDVIEFTAPRVLAFFAGKRTTLYSLFIERQSDRDLWEYLRVVGATYVTTSRLDNPIWTRFVASHGRCFSGAYSNEEFRVYRVDLACENNAALHERFKR
ncbi:MAG TPA: phospholipid carrier-dependent glycosyltransferase [Candidatus Acidoferrales bacterium]|nr:phospholipid carrier-dependent glycosyltransferase [Candidatus Acidoferrales bacterium]